MIICNLEKCNKKGDKKCSRCQLVYYCSKEHQLNDWKQHKKVCIPIQNTNNSISSSISTSITNENITTNNNNNNFILIQTIEGINKKVCQKHKREICQQCLIDYSSLNKRETYNQFLKISQNLVQEENNLNLATTCSNPNCKSKWSATEDFTPPIIDPSELKKCSKCRHAFYCSKDCMDENKEEHKIICKLYTPLYRDIEGINMSYCVGSILEQMYEELFTGLRMRIIFFNGDIDPITSLHYCPYYILEYLPLSLSSSIIIISTNENIENNEINQNNNQNENKEEERNESLNNLSITWRRCNNNQNNNNQNDNNENNENIVERLINNQQTETFVQIKESIQSEINEEEEENNINNENNINKYIVESWINGKQFVNENNELKERFVLIECKRLMNEVREKKWRIVL